MVGRASECSTRRAPPLLRAGAFHSVVCFAFVLVAASCAAGSEQQSPPTALPPDAVLTVDDEEFLDQLVLIDAEVEREESDLRNALQLGRDQRLDALSDLLAIGTSDLMYQAARQLMPDLLQPDHDLYVQYLRQSSGLSTRLQRAIDEDSHDQAYLETVAIFSARARALVALSPHVCGAISDGGQPYCEGALGANSYESRLRATFRELASEVLPRLEYFPDDFSPEEARQVLLAMLPPTIAAVEDAQTAMGRLEPPSALRADHERLVAYLETVFAVATFMLSAVEEGDMGPGLGVEALTDPRRETALGLSADARAIVAPYFDLR